MEKLILTQEILSDALTSLAKNGVKDVEIEWSSPGRKLF